MVRQEKVRHVGTIRILICATRIIAVCGNHLATRIPDRCDKNNCGTWESLGHLRLVPGRLESAGDGLDSVESGPSRIWELRNCDKDPGHCDMAIAELPAHVSCTESVLDMAWIPWNPGHVG